MDNENRYAYSFTPVSPEKPKKYKKGHFLLLGSLLVCITLAGSMLGGYFGIQAMRTEQTQAPQSVSFMPTADPIPVPTAEAPGILTTVQTGRTLSNREIYQKCNPGTVAIAVESIRSNVFGQPTVRASAGSGFILTEDGYVVTNNHVIEGASSVKVLLWDGREYEAEMVGSDAQTDIAVLKVEADGLSALEVGDSDACQVGDAIAVIGNPLGELQNTMTSGIVSAIGRELNIDGTPLKMLQIDAAVNPGNSGGPLFNEYGQVVGIISAKSMGSGIEGLGFAIPMREAQEIISALVQDGYVSGRPFLGISGQTINEQMARYYNLPVGVYVQEVTIGSAAENAGIKRGDVIVDFGGTAIQTQEALTAAKQAFKAGDSVTVRVYREGREYTFTVILDEERPQNVILALPESEQAA